MIFGGLSEKEVQEISKLLELENIPFKTAIDSNIMQANENSMQHNLRHLNPPSISTNILAIEIEDKDFEEMSAELESKLLDYGITNKVPTDLEFSSEPIEPIQSELLKGSKNVIGINWLHQIILMLAFAVLYFLIKNYF